MAMIRIGLWPIPGRIFRIGLLMSAAILVAPTDGEVLAKTGKRHLHVRHFAVHGRAARLAMPLQLALQQPARLGAMRYYGGPKSPMWRAPAEN
jgi:hypothetical protein